METILLKREKHIAEPEEIVKFIKRTFGPVAMQNLAFSIKHNKEWAKDYQKQLKRRNTEHEQRSEVTHKPYTLGVTKTS
ncbi:hypothetical protein [Helicobacter bizzozeronii]|uniref:hypothetical protein n=1 Tax=Helicobacter bizzozeronii TaxID=56877 RepID=UPI00131589D2|nr:hypothetical protein [Helicobacter bizzozeronii]